MEIELQKFFTELQKLLRKNDKDICENFLLEIDQLDSECIREINASKSPSCTYLDGALTTSQRTFYLWIY